MSERTRTRASHGGLPIDLWRVVNRAAYSRSQASFAEHRARLVAEAAAMLKAGHTAAEVSAAMLAHERAA
jgi:hypothetical protein